MAGPTSLIARNTLLPHQGGSSRLPGFSQPQSQQASRPVVMPKPERSAKVACAPLSAHQPALDRCRYLE